MPLKYRPHSFHLHLSCVPRPELLLLLLKHTLLLLLFIESALMEPAAITVSYHQESVSLPLPLSLSLRGLLFQQSPTL